MGGHPHDLTSAMVNDEKDVQCLKPKGLNRKTDRKPKSRCCAGSGIVASQGGRSVVGTPHVSGDRARTDLEAKSRQFSLDSALSP